MIDALDRLRFEVRATQAAAEAALAIGESAALGWVISLIDRERNRILNPPIRSSDEPTSPPSRPATTAR